MLKTIPLVIAAAILAGAANAQLKAAPVVIELFQSQGCSSCPPANANVNALAAEPGVLALSFAVDYWDSLGWKDTFASPAYTRRQWDYAHGLRNSNVATPQVVINGAQEVVGNDRRTLDRAVAAAGHPAAIEIAGNTATIAASPGAKAADIWLVRYDPRVRQVAVKRGENNGKTLPHRNIVVGLSRLGRYDGKAQTVTVPPSADPALKTAIVVQASGGPILAAGSS